MSASDKVVTLPIGEDEAGMRLDRWFRRRYPDLPQTHLNKIVRKGEVRVDGKRVEISTRLEAGQNVRVPPLHLRRRARAGRAGAAQSRRRARRCARCSCSRIATSSC